MLIIACDFHTRFQQTAMMDPCTGMVSSVLQTVAQWESGTQYTDTKQLMPACLRSFP